LRATLGMPTVLKTTDDRKAWAEYVVECFLKTLN
jgi:hypothetical protein